MLLTSLLFLGPFKNDNKHGKGILTYSNGDKYEGMFVNGKREGKGTYTFKGDRPKEGNYHNDERVNKTVSTKHTAKTTSSQCDQQKEN